MLNFSGNASLVVEITVDPPAVLKSIFKTSIFKSVLGERDREFTFRVPISISDFSFGCSLRLST
jgi:hypothetical protein